MSFEWVSVTLCVAVRGHLTQQLLEERLIWADRAERQPLMMGKSWRQALEAAARIASAAKKQRGM